MKVNVIIQVRRDDGTTLTRDVSTSTQRVYVGGAFKNETRADLRKRVDRLTTAALKSTLGR